MSRTARGVEKRRRGKILYSLIVVMTVAGLAPLLLMSARLIRTNRDHLSTQEKVFQLDQTRSIAQQARLYLEAMSNQIFAIAQTFEIGGDARAVADRIRAVSSGAQLMNYINENTHILAISVYGREEQGGFAGYPMDEPEIIGYYRTAYEQGLAGRPWVSPPHVSEPLLDTVVVISAPIFAPVRGADTPRRVVGVVAAAVSLEPLQEMVEAKSGLGREVYVVAGDGRLIAHSDREVLFTHRDLSGSVMVRAFLEARGQASGTVNFEVPVEEEEGGFWPFRRASRRMVGTYTSIGDPRSGLPFLRELDWAAIVQAEEDAVYHAVRVMERTSYSVAVLSAILTAILALVFAGQLSRPIAQLAEGARRLAAGDFSQNISVRANNELGVLAETFNFMRAEIRRYIDRLRQAAEENKQMFMGAVRSLAAAIDAKDPYTRGHSERVSHYAEQIARVMGLEERQVEIVRISALMHDVGKIGIEDKILGKAGPLTEEEYEIMKTHPVKGAVIMEQVPQLKEMIPGMKYHHENVDGTGYPEGLKGDEIPLTAKIVSVADTFDAMTTNRPYQKAMEIGYVLERMRSFVGKKFEKHIVEALIQAYEEGRIRPNMPVQTAIATAEADASRQPVAMGR